MIAGHILSGITRLLAKVIMDCPGGFLYTALDLCLELVKKSFVWSEEGKTRWSSAYLVVRIITVESWGGVNRGNRKLKR